MVCMTTNEPVADFPEVLTTAMAADLLHVHVEYLRRMVREGRIPAHRFPEGREIRFLRDEEGYFEANVRIDLASKGGPPAVTLCGSRLLMRGTGALVRPGVA